MTVRALSSTSIELPMSGVWVIAVCGSADDDAPVVTVTLPAGGTATPSVESIGGGVYRAEYIVGSAGRYVARAVTASHGAADFAAFVTATVAATAMPDVDDVRAYLDGDSYDDEQIAGALAAESDAQRRVCSVPAAYPNDLREALLRRVQRNLVMRAQPLMVIPGAEDGAPSVIPSRDAEVRRLEAPFRKLIVG
jgi:hypothetical protein